MRRRRAGAFREASRTTPRRWRRSAAPSCASRPAPTSRTSAQYSFDPASAAGQHRELHRRRAGADRRRRAAADRRRARAGRLLRPAGDHRGHAGRQLQPRHAPPHRVRRRPKTTVVERLDAARARCSSSTTRVAGARVRALGRGALRGRSATPPRRRPASGKLIYIGQYQVGPLRYLRFNYTTGDAAGQNMTGKATLRRVRVDQGRTIPGGAAVHPARATSTPTRSTRTSTCC